MPAGQRPAGQRPTGTAPAKVETMIRSMVSIGALLAALSLVGCVAQGKYDAAIADATQAHASREAREKEQVTTRAELAKLKEELAATKLELENTQEELDFAGGIALSCGQALEDQNALNEDLLTRLDHLGR